MKASGSKVETFHRNLKSSQVDIRKYFKFQQYFSLQGDCLSKLQELSLSDEVKCEEMLEEIAVEQHFEVTFVEIEEISKRGLHQCMVQMSTLPVSVCYGENLLLLYKMITKYFFRFW